MKIHIKENKAQSAGFGAGTKTDFGTFESEHIKIAKKLDDIVGESRSYWALGLAHQKLGQKEQASHYLRLHRDISRRTGDEEGVVFAEGEKIICGCYMTIYDW